MQLTSNHLLCVLVLYGFHVYVHFLFRLRREAKRTILCSSNVNVFFSLVAQFVMTEFGVFMFIFSSSCVLMQYVVVFYAARVGHGIA